MKFEYNTKFLGGSLMGYIDITYADLVATFGAPNSKGDAYKVDAEWDLMFEDGTHARIYNYKDGKNYNGDEGDAVEDITNWHIGGTSSRALEAVTAALSKKAITHEEYMKQVFG